MNGLFFVDSTARLLKENVNKAVLSQTKTRERSPGTELRVNFLRQYSMCFCLCLLEKVGFSGVKLVFFGYQGRFVLNQPMLPA